MTDDAQQGDERTLHALWRAGRPADLVVPDALTLAAYAENGLDESEAAAVEHALSLDLDLFDAIVAARGEPEFATVPPELLRRAEAAHPDRLSAKVLPFRRRPAALPQLRDVVGWGALAATLLLVSYMGFGLGASAQQALEGANNAESVDILDASDAAAG
jgi:hypothetical protein